MTTTRLTTITGTDTFTRSGKRFDANTTVEQAKEDATLGGCGALLITGAEGTLSHCSMLGGTDSNAMTVDCSEIVIEWCILSGGMGKWTVDAETPEGRWVRGISLNNYSRVTYRHCLMIDWDIRWADGCGSRIDVINCLVVRDHWRPAIWQNCRGNVINTYFVQRAVSGGDPPIVIPAVEGVIAEEQELGMNRLYQSGNVENGIPVNPFGFQGQGYEWIGENISRATPWGRPSAVSAGEARDLVLAFAGPAARNDVERELIKRAS